MTWKVAAPPHVARNWRRLGTLVAALGVALAVLTATGLLRTALADTGAGPVGHWALINQSQPLHIEFRADGSYRARAVQGVLRGHWALVDAEHLATWSSADRPRRVNRFRVERDHLVIIDSDGTQHIHRRVPSRPGEAAAQP